MAETVADWAGLGTWGDGDEGQGEERDEVGDAHFGILVVVEMSDGDLGWWFGLYCERSTQLRLGWGFYRHSLSMLELEG